MARQEADCIFNWPSSGKIPCVAWCASETTSPPSAGIHSRANFSFQAPLAYLLDALLLQVQVQAEIGPDTSQKQATRKPRRVERLGIPSSPSLRAPAPQAAAKAPSSAAFGARLVKDRTLSRRSRLCFMVSRCFFWPVPAWNPFIPI